jgi:hypothetical protein
VNDAAGLVDDEHGGCQRIERVGECCGFDLMTVDDIADQKRAADMRDDEAPSVMSRMTVKMEQPDAK